MSLFLQFEKRITKKVKLSIIPILLISTISYAQTPVQQPIVGVDAFNYISKISVDKMKLFDTSKLNNLDLTMETRKIPGLSVQHKSLSASSNLSQAQEYENRFNYGYSFSKTSTLSINAINQKTFGSPQEDNFLALGFTKKTNSMFFDIKFHQIDTTKSNLNGKDSTVATVTAKILL